MPKLLQINVMNNMLSTGKVCEGISRMAASRGWDCYVAYGRSSRESVSSIMRIGTDLHKYLHYLEFRLFDNEGLSSRRPTAELIGRIREINPDIIHLHNIHDHYLNYEILFSFLSEAGIPVVWTQHDCWAFTGGCMYYDLFNCGSWESGGCAACPERRSLVNRSERNLRKKMQAFSSVPRLVLVPVSDWLHSSLDRSFFKEREIVTVHNGIDLKRFHPFDEPADTDRFSILGVAAVWDARKGLEDFVKLRELLPEEYGITLVGLNASQISGLPRGIKGIGRTSSVEELARMYSNADVLVNTTYSDNFPTVNLEALACGTPVITYASGGSPEAVDESTGVVIDCGDVSALASAMRRMRVSPLSSSDCRARAEKHFDRDSCFDAYIDIYNSLLSE